MSQSCASKSHAETYSHSKRQQEINKDVVLAEADKDTLKLMFCVSICGRGARTGKESRGGGESTGGGAGRTSGGGIVVTIVRIKITC